MGNPDLKELQIKIHNFKQIILETEKILQKLLSAKESFMGKPYLKDANMGENLSNNIIFIKLINFTKFYYHVHRN